MELEVRTTVERPVAVVWDFYAVHHVENHPRWDPDVRLERTDDGPIRVGSVIRRYVTRFEVPTEGTMEVVAFEPERAMRVRTQDGHIAINGWATFTAVGEGRTGICIGADFPQMDASMAERVRPLMERSIRAIKDLIESET